MVSRILSSRDTGHYSCHQKPVIIGPAFAGPVPFWTQRHTSADTGLIMATCSSGFLGEVPAATHRSRPAAVITAPSASGTGPAGLGLVPQLPSSASSDRAASPRGLHSASQAGSSPPGMLQTRFFFFFTILFLSNLHPPRGAPAHSPEIRSRGSTDGASQASLVTVILGDPPHLSLQSEAR